LSTVLKQFVKEETGQTNLKIDYLKELLAFTKFYRPLHIFSTNYDVCIERFAEVNYKSYFDGFFDGRWDVTKFDSIDKDLYLYKLHGSVTWSRDEKGRYTRNEIAITDTTEPQINIVSGEKEVPLISYPGRKLEYFEPLFDLN
jgi:SIR2-like domain